VCPANGKYVPEFTINAAEIVELVEAVNENAAPPSVAKAHPAQGPAPPPQKPKTFEDPAILSMGKRPTPVLRPLEAPTQWNSTSMERKDSSRTATGKEDRVLKDITPAATLVEPFSSVSMERIESSRTATGRKGSISTTLVDPIQKIHIADVDTDGVAEGLILDEHAEVPVAQPAIKQKRFRKRKGRRNEDSLEPDVVPSKETQRSKGWRKTPLLEPNPSFQPFTTLKKSNRRNGRADENGWATEDATDVQDMGDFDFQGSLAKFDKKTVFTQIQADDGIPDEDRLVSHNRLPRPKPGTAGGKNLHYTENVLDLPNGNAKTDIWKSEAGDSDLEERPVQRDSGSGRHSRRAGSRVPDVRRPPSRKGSNIQPARTLSVSLSLDSSYYP
jgi:enhancer of mRNA-decapping protein 3